MNNESFILALKNFGACDDGIAWAGKRDSRQVWEECERGDWLLWLAGKLEIDHRTLTLAKGKCAETVIHLMAGDRSKEAVRVAISYGEGTVTEEELRIAANAAAYAANAANAAAATRSSHLKLCADIVRSVINFEIIQEQLNKLK